MLMVPKKAKEIHPLSELDDLSFKKIVSKLIISNPGVWDGLVESLQVLSSEELIELSRDLSDGALQ